MADLDWHGDEILAQLHGDFADGLQLGAEHLLQVSRTEVPIDEATLERSGVASIDRDDLVAAVSYDTPYAVRQHEEMDYRHSGGRKAKYLEDPFHQERDTMLALIAAPLREEIGG